jgi:hypothetical protein
MKMLLWNKHDLMRSNDFHVFKNSFDDLYPLYKYDILEENNPIVYCTIYYACIIFIFIFYLLL